MQVKAWALALVLAWVLGLTGTPGHAAAARCDGLPAMERVRCEGVLRVGLRTGYPPFSQWQAGVPEGFEPELALVLAKRLGVRMEPVLVTPANRMAMLGEQRVDLVIATMGHTLQRDGQARFIRPHYFESRTIILGERGVALDALGDVAGRTVCVTVGNLTNAELAANGARLKLFDSGSALLDQIRRGACPLAAQDDTFFEMPLRETGIQAVREIKIGFSATPWGMAVRQEDGQALQDWLSRELRALHASGDLLAIAGRWGLARDFLLVEQRRWSQPPCALPLPPADCLAPPRDASLMATPVAPAVDRIEAWVLEHLGVRLSLPMLKTRVAWDLFLAGVGYSLVLVAGSVVATVALAALFALGMRSPRRLARWPARGVQAVMQSTPLMLLMLLGDLALTGLNLNSPLASLLVAVLVLGLFNGSNAGQAVAESESGQDPPPSLAQAMVGARVQLMSFAVNATRGSPTAAVMGVPELLAALSDIGSFVSERSTTYTLLLIFYVAVVFAVIALGQRVVGRWEGARS